MNLFDGHQISLIKTMARSMNRSQLESLVLSYAQKEGEEQFRNKVVNELMRVTKPASIVPLVYHDFSLVVEDGIRFLLEHISLNRLIQLSLDQLMLDEHARIEERLILMAKRIPTLHKLGQVIARNKNIDKNFKNWLIQLEHGFHGTDVKEIHTKIKQELGHTIDEFQITLDDRIFFEASVGATVKFTWVDKNTQKPSNGIFKVLKPNIKEYIEEELDILDQLAIYLDHNRHRYGLKQFRFIETFSDVRTALSKEIDLSGEQLNLKKASEFYYTDSFAQIPKVLPFSTQQITAMTFMNGERVTDVQLSHTNRRRLAHELFNIVFWMPLFSNAEQTIFHGDPHAGNIYAFEDSTRTLSIALLDWSLSGRLSKFQRLHLFKLIIGVMAMDEDLIVDSTTKLSENQESISIAKKISSLIPVIVSNKNYQQASFIKKSFLFIDQTAFHGVHFSKDLMLLRKSIFTLEGVLKDIDPDFNVDLSTFRLFESLIAEEFPKRWAQAMFPFMYSSDTFKTIMSNHEIFSLVTEMVSKKIRKSIEAVRSIMPFYWSYPIDESCPHHNT